MYLLGTPCRGVGGAGLSLVMDVEKPLNERRRSELIFYGGGWAA